MPENGIFIYQLNISNMRKLFLLLLIYSAAIHAWAERVNVSTAKQVATNVAERLNSTNNLRSNGGVSLVYTAPAETSLSTRSTSREADYYIFNVGNGNGFVIVSGFDYRLTKDGRKYGWGITRYALPEAIFGDDTESMIDSYTPESAFNIMKKHLMAYFPDDEHHIEILLGGRRT